VTEKGDFYWNKEAVDLAVAVSRLRQLKQSEADPKVFINAMPRHISEISLQFWMRREK
jgi:biopolymer transport protein ExbD